MKNLFWLLLLTFTLSACGGGAETPESVSKTWCDMNKKIKSIDKGDEKTKLKQKQNDFEKQIEEKYKDNDEFMKKVKELTRACD